MRWNEEDLSWVFAALQSQPCAPQTCGGLGVVLSLLGSIPLPNEVRVWIAACS